MEVKFKSYFFEIWAGVGLISLVIIWNLPWRFQTNDDEVMMWLVSGAYTGKPESYAVFIHPILSWIFSKLFTLAPSVPWYPFAWVFILYCSFLVFVRLIGKQNRFGVYRTLWVFFGFALFVHFLFFIQFSFVSAFAITVGLAYRLHRENPNNSLFSIFSEDLLILLGFLIRPEILLLFLLGILVVQGVLFREFSSIKKMSIPAVLWVLGTAITWIWIGANGLQEFQDANLIRSQVFDHPVLQLHKEELKLSEPELYHFSNGLIDFQLDHNMREKLSQWKELLDQKRSELFDLEAVYKALSTFILYEHFLLGLFGLFMVFAFLWNSKKAGIYLLVIFGILILSIPFYLLKVQIYVILFLFFFLGMVLNTPRLLPVWSVFWIGIFLLSTAVGFHFYSFFRSSVNEIPAKKLSEELDALQGKGQIYLIGKGAYYRELLFDYPLKFKILGWPTLLEAEVGIQKDEKNIYLVDSVTYSNNLQYFAPYEKYDSQTSLILLIQK